MGVVLVLLLGPLLAFSRYGLGWAAAEFAALIAWWPPILLVKAVTWRRGPWWTFPFVVFVMTTLFFAVAAMLFGLWLSSWWCLVISLGAAMLTVAGIWPAQMRYYRLQRKLLEQEHASSEGDRKSVV